MGWCIRLSLALFLGGLLSLNPCFADIKGIKYSMPPTCKEGKVVCGEENEKPVCVVFDSDASDLTEYVPSCDGEPKCIGKSNDLPAPHNVELNCLTFAKCQDGVPQCNDGKIAKCFGSSNEPQGCNCPDGIPVCEYTWQTSNISSYNLH